MIYTTNAVESLHRSLRKVIKTRGSFPTDDAAIKLLYLAVQTPASAGEEPIKSTRRSASLPSSSPTGLPDRHADPGNQCHGPIKHKEPDAARCSATRSNDRRSVLPSSQRRPPHPRPAHRESARRRRQGLGIDQPERPRERSWLRRSHSRDREVPGTAPTSPRQSRQTQHSSRSRRSMPPEQSSHVQQIMAPRIPPARIKGTSRQIVINQLTVPRHSKPSRQNPLLNPTQILLSQSDSPEKPERLIPLAPAARNVVTGGRWSV